MRCNILSIIELHGKINIISISIHFKFRKTEPNRNDIRQYEQF